MSWLTKMLLIVLISLPFSGISQDEIDIKNKAEKAIISWAETTFEYFDAPRFENFYLSPSPDFYALTILKEEYNTFKDEIVFNYNESKSDRTEEQLKRDTASISNKIKELDMILDNMSPKFDHIEYFFWANIQTDNGLTVYYQHQIKLDETYNIISFRESSSIGKPENVNILFK